MREKTYHDNECEVYCTDTDKTVIGEVHRFEKDKMLSVVIERSAQINMRYNPRHKIYIGNTSGLEFTSEGPRTHTIKQRSR